MVITNFMLCTSPVHTYTHLYKRYVQKPTCKSSIWYYCSLFFNPNSLDNKGSCWILLDCYCSVTMLRKLELKGRYNRSFRLVSCLQQLILYLFDITLSLTRRSILTTVLSLFISCWFTSDFLLSSFPTFSKWHHVRRNNFSGRLVQ